MSPNLSRVRSAAQSQYSVTLTATDIVVFKYSLLKDGAVKRLYYGDSKTVNQNDCKLKSSTAFSSLLKASWSLSRLLPVQMMPRFHVIDRSDSHSTKFL